jgi:hypothetical protein
MDHYKLQSVLIPKTLYKLDNAIKWIDNHCFKLKKIDETINFYRFRQIDPSYIGNLGYTNYKIKKLSNGIELVLAYLK